MVRKIRYVTCSLCVYVCKFASHLPAQPLSGCVSQRTLTCILPLHAFEAIMASDHENYIYGAAAVSEGVTNK